MDINMALTVIVTGVLVPFVVGIFASPTMPPQQKRTIAIVVSVIMGILAAIVTGAISEIPDSVVEYLARAVVIVAVIIGLAQGYYKAFQTQVDTFTEKVGNTK